MLVSTTNQQPWVINAQACSSYATRNFYNAVSQMSPQQHDSSHGHVFNVIQSSKWYETGYHTLQSRVTLAANKIKSFGLDAITLGLLGQGLRSTLRNITTSTIGTYTHWLAVAVERRCTTNFSSKLHHRIVRVSGYPKLVVWLHCKCPAS